jgi:hypothetical protein
MDNNAISKVLEIYTWLLRHLAFTCTSSRSVPLSLNLIERRSRS